MVEQIVFWLTYLVEKIGYGGVAISMFIESFFVPIPSELIMPFAGFIASQGKMNLYVLIILGGVASYVGSLPFYFIGYWGNKLVVEKFLKKYGKYLFVSEEDVDKGFEIFNKYGKAIVMFGRVIPIIRSVISFPAGVAKMNFLQFSIYTLLGSIIWSGILATLGFVLGGNWSIIGSYISRYEDIVLILLGILVVGFVVYKLINRKK
jgi:membrane protein DedA with SNARE-associated domain